MSRLQLSHKYILVPLALLTLLAVVPAPTRANAGRPMRTGKSRSYVPPGVLGRGRGLLSGQVTRVELPNRDADKVQAFKTLFLLRLYMIFQQMYLEHLPQAKGWSQIADDYRAMAALSKDFSRLAAEHVPTSHFFDENGYYFEEMAALSAEVDGALKNNAIPSQYSQLLFRKLVLVEGGPVGYPKQYHHLIGPWVNRFNVALSRLSRIIAAAFEGWKLEYNFDANQAFTATERLPFKLPFEEFADQNRDLAAVAYLYDAFVKDAGLPPAMESFYSETRSRDYRVARVDMLFRSGEIAQRLMERISAWVPARLVVRVFVDISFNCADKIRKEQKATHYERLSRMHRVIYDYVIQGDQVLFYLKQLAENKKAELRYNRPKYERQIGYLQKVTEEYLAERARLTRYPKGWADETARLAESSRKGQLDQLSEPDDMNAFLDAVAQAIPWTPKDARSQVIDLIDPCGRLYDLLKASLQEASAGVEPLSQQIDLSAVSAGPEADATPRGEQTGLQGTLRSRANAPRPQPAPTLGNATAPRTPAAEKPPTAEELVGRAEDDYRYGRYESAAGACREALKADPDQPRANLLLGKVYYQTKEYERSVPHLAKALALGETLTLPIAHHRKVFAGEGDNGTDNDLNVGEIAVRKDRLELRFTSNVTRTGVRVSDESFSVSLDRVYELKYEPGKEGRLRLVVGIAQGDGASKEKRRTYNFYPADARVVREDGKLMSLSDTEIRCAPCSPETRLLHDLLVSLRK